jgi:hypothetical protein
MSLHDLGESVPAALRRAADGVSAPPSAGARDRVRRRAGTLRRRRRAGMALAGTVVLVAGLGGALVLRDDGTEPVTAGPQAGPGRWADGQPPAGDGELPAFAVDGLEPTGAHEDGGPLESPGDAGGHSFQVFRRSDDYAGPTVFVQSGPGLGIPEPGEAGVETVQVAGHEAGLSRYNPDVPSLGWHLADGRVVYIRSWELSIDELLSFAGGLDLRTGGTGFDAVTLPRGLAEDPVEEAQMTEYGMRELSYDTPTGTVEIRVNLSGEDGFESYVSDRFDSADTVEQIVVFERPAVLVHYGGTQRWSLQWRHTTTARVEVVVEGGDRSTVDDVVTGLREIDEADWQDLLERYGR